MGIVFSGGGSMDCPERSEVAVARLPDDVLVEILSRLRAKPLFRFKCLSKSWCDLIADRLRCRKSPQTLEGFFHGGIGTYGDFTDLLGRSVPLVDPSFSFLTKLPGVENIVLVDSRNGLLLFEHPQDGDTIGYIVCNPATEQWVAVPSSGWTPLIQGESDDEFNDYMDWRRRAHAFLVFDPAVSSHFHLVQVWQERYLMAMEGVHTYSSETGMWSDATREWRRYGEGGEWEQWVSARVRIKSDLSTALTNGMLHVPAYLHYLTPENPLIVAMDGQGKTYRIIRWPDENKFAAATFIGQSQGHLYCISGHQKPEDYNVHITGLSIWVLEDYDTEQWVLKQSVSFWQLFGKVSCRENDYDVVAIHPDRNIVFFVQHLNRKLIS